MSTITGEAERVSAVQHKFIVGDSVYVSYPVEGKKYKGVIHKVRKASTIVAFPDEDNAKITLPIKKYWLLSARESGSGSSQQQGTQDDAQDTDPVQGGEPKVKSEYALPKGAQPKGDLPKLEDGGIPPGMGAD